MYVPSTVVTLVAVHVGGAWPAAHSFSDDASKVRPEIVVSSSGIVPESSLPSGVSTTLLPYAAKPVSSTARGAGRGSTTGRNCAVPTCPVESAT